MALMEEIDQAKRLVSTDAYQMSIGEIVSMYENGELVIDPEFQRLFRWKIGQKSKLIESLLLGIPVPSIFVFEKPDGRWELIDGLQRLSSILEFMGKLKDENGILLPPSILNGTNYLHSLNNTVWEESDKVPEVPIESQKKLDKSLQLAIRRSRLGLEILKRPSDDKTKFDLFQRLNAGGTEANPQELRNCVMIMVSSSFFREVKAAAESANFIEINGLNDEQRDRQRHLELAVRFLVLTYIAYDDALDVEEFIDKGIVELANQNAGASARALIEDTFQMLQAASGKDALKRFENGRHSGKIGLVGLEGIAVGIAKNLPAIKAQANPAQFIKQKIESFWSQPPTANLTSPGMRGTTRIQRTVPFGELWFRP